MEDWNMLASDFIVISCCCPCLILHIFIFFLLKLPYKLVQKTKKYANKKLGCMRRGNAEIDKRRNRYREEHLFAIDGGSLRNDFHGCECCMEEVEKVLEELSRKGEFAFGSFWGGDELGSLPTSIVAKHGFDSDVVDYHFVEMASSVTYL
ncbi:hypothetical protein Acr_29g0005170 [Actinidia rufa]|uniref:Uncharacterized protein n=1 Tax=Actinidia rufa TaxID=165716 RepID=A0A7J0HEE2_9ERIC|nr:hypothetical protein Acr_29g0005170 [Actinidia rufa]